MLVGIIGCSAQQSARPAASEVPRHQPIHIDARFTSPPLAFEKSEGQSTAFSAQLRGRRLSLFPTEAVLSFAHTALHMAFLHGQSVTPIGTEVLAGRVNYFRGNNRSHWQTGAPLFRSVRYSAVWPGVDVVFHGDGSTLEYDFVVAPGADPRLIHLRFQGAERVQVDSQGNLRLRLQKAEVVHPRPHVYEEREDGSGRKDVSGRYVQISDDEVAFDIGPYAQDRRLIIDPVIVYSTYFGGTGVDFGNGIAVDASANTYLIGYTASTDLTTHNAAQPTSIGSPDAFVVKLTPAGAIAYATYLGGSAADYGSAIAVDSAGNAFLTGYTNSGDFPTLNALQPAPGGGNDAFVAKLSPSGALVYSTYLGGSLGDDASSIAVDSTGAAYVTGETASPDFPTLSAAQSAFNGGATDGFVAKLTAAGALAYSTYLGGGASENGNGISLDSAGNAWVAGTTASTDFPTLNAAQAALNGPNDAFVTKLSSAGTFLYSSYLGGTATDGAAGIAVDSAGNGYVTGATTSSDFPTAAAIQPAFKGPTDAFVTKLSNTGALIYSSYLGGNGDENGAGIAVDSAGNGYVTGFTTSNDFPASSNATQSVAGGVTDAFVTRIDASGALTFSTYLGGSSDDRGKGIAVDTVGDAYVVGYTNSLNFPTANAAQGSLQGSLYDAFTTKLGGLAVDAGIPDGGVPDGGVPGGGPTSGVGPASLLELRVGCACQASDSAIPFGLFSLLVCLWATAVRPRRR